MPKRNARSGFPPEPSNRSDRAVSTFFVSPRSQLPTNQSPQEESVIRSDELAFSAPAKHQRARSARWRGVTVGAVSLAAMLGTALVPALGSMPAGASGPTVATILGHSGSSTPSLGVPVPKASAKISPTYVAYNSSNGDTAVAQTKAGSVFVYLIAGGTGSEANEYNIQTAPNPSPAFGSLTSGDAYIVAGTGTAGLIAQPGNNQFGNSTTAVATSNPITPTSVAFDPNGNLLIAGQDGTNSAVQVVAKSTGTFYGVAMTAGDLYTIADVGVSGAPSTSINMGDEAAAANGMSVDSTGNIVVGNGDGVDFINEQASTTLSLYGQSIPAQTSAVIAGNTQGGTDCSSGAASASASSLFFQSSEPTIDSADNVYLSDNEAGGPDGGGCDWVLPAQSGTIDGLSVTAGNVYKLAGNGGTTATTDGTAGVNANVSGTSQMALDNAGNVVLAVSGAAPGTSPALQVLAESTATYYGVAMTAGDIYTVAGGPSNTAATLSGPTSILNSGSGNLLFTDGSASSANLDEFSGAPTAPAAPPAGGAITLAKSTALIGNYPDKVSGSGWAADTTVTLNQCASTTYSSATCDAANRVSVTLGTGHAAGIFKNAVIHLAAGVIDSNGDTCGVAGSTPCYVVVVGNTGDTTSSGQLGFTLPSFAVKEKTAVLGNYVDAVKAIDFPIGDTIVAQECDASVLAPSTVSTNCDSTTDVSETAGATGTATFSPGVALRVGSAYSDTAGGTCEVGGSCDIGVTDSDNSAIGLSTAVGFTSPVVVVKETTNVLGNYVDSVKATGFPIGDSIMAQECDPNLVFPASVASDCDTGTQVSATASAKGTVTFSPGVTLRVGGAFSDSAGGACSAGGSCEVLVSDSANPSVGLEKAVTFAAPTASARETSNVQPNYVDKVTATDFPVGDTVTAQECDGAVTSANLASHCDSATRITGTVSAKGTVTFTSAGVTILIGTSYTDGSGGTAPANGSADIVVNDSSDSGFYIAIPVGLS
jgi:hypothetical protein